MVGKHHRLNAHEFVQTLGDSEGWNSLGCWSPWGHKKLDTTQRLNNTTTKQLNVLKQAFKHMSVQFSHSVMSHSLQPHGLQHIRLLCPPSSPGICSNFIELVMLSSQLILCCPCLLLPSIFSSIMVFSNESVLRIRWPEYWSFSFSISPSNNIWN